MNEAPHGFTLYGKTPAGVEYQLNIDVDVTDPEQLAQRLGSIDAALKSAGFTRSERLDKPAGGYGGGGRGQQQRAETPPPAGIVRPEHCGQPMRYVLYKKDGKKATPAQKARDIVDGQAEMWICAKDKQCEDVTSGRSEKAAANFDMKPIGATSPATAPKESAPAATSQPDAAQGSAAPATDSSAPKPASAAKRNEFWELAKALGFREREVLNVARTNSIDTFTTAELKSLYEHIKATQQGKRPGQWSRAA